jgi:hypothetical protein
MKVLGLIGLFLAALKPIDAASYSLNQFILIFQKTVCLRRRVQLQGCIPQVLSREPNSSTSVIDVLTTILPIQGNTISAPVKCRLPTSLPDGCEIVQVQALIRFLSSINQIDI